MVYQPRRYLAIFKRAGQKFGEDHGAYMAAAVAFFALFSIFPLLLFMVAIAIWTLRDPSAQPRVIDLFARLMPASIEIVRDVLARVQGNATGLGILGAIGFLWGGSGVFTALEYALNLAFDAPAARSLVRRTVLAVGMALLVGALVVVGVAAQTLALALGRLQRFLGPSGVSDFMYPSLARSVLLQLLTLLALIAGAFLIYYLVPNIPRSARRVWFGAAVAGVALFAGQAAFNWYLLIFANFSLVYGPVTAVVALMIWLYVAAAIIIFGGELNAARTELAK